MAKRKSQKQVLATASSREMSVVKRDDMIQNARFSLSVQEQRCVLYAISRIKPDDEVFSEYTFDIKDFYALCGIENESYTRLKQILIGLRQKTWMIQTGPNTESTVSWFNKVRTNKSDGKVTIRFDDDMMPYLLQLASQAKEQGMYFTQYGLKYVLPMRGQYSPRLYELLKSYQKNNREWFFDIEELKRLLDCQNYKNFNDFKRFVLTPAIEEINEYTDLNVAYDTERSGRGGKVTRVIFFMAGKSKQALEDTNKKINRELDGQVSLEDFMGGYDNSVRQKFWQENPFNPTELPSDDF